MAALLDEYTSIAEHNRDIAEHYHDLAERRGLVLLKLWLLAETVEDRTLANEIRMTMISEILPDAMIIHNAPDDEIEDEQ
jgi:hypothetical protein